MPGNINWQSGAVQSFALQLSGQGAQITNGVATGCSGILDNRGVSGGPGFFAVAQFQASQSGFGAATAANTSVDFYLVPSRDGVTYPNVDIAGANLPTGSLKGSFLVTVSGNNQAIMNLENIPLMPLKYTGYIKNNTGQTLTSGWGIVIDLYSESYT